MTDSAHRIECEAREWLRRCRYNPQRIEELLERIGKKRGKAGAEKLRLEMRRQWKNEQTK